MPRPPMHRIFLAALLFIAALCFSFTVLPPLSHAADLIVTGGQGGNSHGNGGGDGGNGGFVKDEVSAFWAAGGGGGGAYSSMFNRDGTAGNTGASAGGGGGGHCGSALVNTNSGGAGGAGATSSGGNSGGANSGTTGGTGGGFSGQTYVGGTFTAHGGIGGSGASNGLGGEGGDAGLDIAGGSYTFITVTGGRGGDGNIGTGGNGGNAALSASSPLNVTSALTVISGITGTDGFGPGGTGGAASLTAGMVTTPSINLTKQGGTLSVSITTLNVTTGGTALTLTGSAASDVNIANVTLGNGNTFTVSGTGAGTFTNLNVTGTGTLAGTYAPSFTNVSLAGSSSLTSTANPLNFSTMRVQGQGAGYTGTLNAAGKSLVFDLPASLTPGQTMLNVTGSADLTGTGIALNSPVRPQVAVGESLTLLDATAGINGFTTLTVQSSNGDEYTLSVSGYQLMAVLSALAPTGPAYERLKAYAEGRAAQLAFVNQGADLILNQGMGSALMATRGPGFQYNAFAAGQGGWSRYNTGSHVDVSGASMLAGVALGNDVGLGRLTAGVFFEGGWGNYNSYNSFSNYASVKGDGDTDYYGGGILGRYDVKQGAAAGLYIDASARMGRASADFGSDDIKYAGGNSSFDSASLYYGAHAGLGYQWGFSEKAMLDLSGKFIWTHQDSDKVSVHEDRVHFKDADSLRTRLGGRFNYAACDYATPYVGAYWEHEFDGEQRSSVNGVGIDTPTLKGDTGVGELGLTLTPVKDSGFSMDLGVQGYTGVREGVTGSLQAKFEF